MMTGDSRRTFILGIACGLLFAIPLSIAGSVGLFFVVTWFQQVGSQNIDVPSSDFPITDVLPSGPRPPSRGDRGHGPFLDQEAPTFTTTTVSGDHWQLADHLGKVVVLDFWASWCQPCIKQIPELRDIYQRYRQRSDFMMVGVSVDEDKSDLLRAVEKHHVEWPQLLEEGAGWDSQVAKLYQVRSIPHVVVIDREGVVRAYPRGRQLATQLTQLLDGSRTASP